MNLKNVNNHILQVIIVEKLKLMILYPMYNQIRIIQKI